MRESVAFVGVARPTVAYAALLAAASSRYVEVVHADARHLTLAFRPRGAAESDGVVLAAVVDAGHGLAKLVLSGRAQDGSSIDLGDLSASLFAFVERRLQSTTS